MDVERKVQALQGADGVRDALKALGDLRCFAGDGEIEERVQRRVVREVMRLSPNWLPLLSEKERNEAFDWAFTGSKNWTVCTVLLALHSLLAELYHEKSDKGERANASTIGDWVAIGQSSARVLATLFINGIPSETFAVTDPLDVDPLVQALVSLPDLLFGLTGGPVQGPFAPSTWFDHLVACLLNRTICENSTRVKFCSKLVAVGHGDRLVRQLFMRSDKVDDAGYFLELDDFLRQKLVFCLVRVANKLGPPRIESALPKVAAIIMVPKDIEPNGVLHSTLLKLLVCQRLQPCLLWELVDFMHRRCSQELVLACLVHVATIWARPSFICGTDVPLHESVSGVLFNLLPLPSQDDLDSSGAAGIIIPGVQNYLENNVRSIRRLGMFVAEAFSSRLESTRGLIFSELENKVFPYDPKQKSAWTLQQAAEEEEEESSPPRISDEEQISNLNHLPNGDADSDKRDNVAAAVASETLFDDPDQVVSFIPGDETDADGGIKSSSSSSRMKSIWDSSSSEDESSSGESDAEDAEIESLAPMGDIGEESAGTRMPTYLCDCIPMLQDDKDYKQAQTALAGIAALIGKRPADLATNALELAAVLLHLENRFGLDDFARNRIEGLVAIASAPESFEPVVLMLASKVFIEAQFTTIRLDAMQVIVRAAKLFSQGEKDEPSPRTCHQSKATIERVGTVTKVWGQRKNPLPQERANRFYAVAPLFFFPLLNPSKDPASTAMLYREPLVLSQLLFSLASILAFSVHSLHVERMARGLLELVFRARYPADDAKVREACLFAVSQIVATVPQSRLNGDVFWQDSVIEIGEWVQLVQKKDPDQACRQHANRLLKAINGGS